MTTWRWLYMFMLFHTRACALSLKPAHQHIINACFSVVALSTLINLTKETWVTRCSHSATISTSYSNQRLFSTFWHLSCVILRGIQKSTLLFFLLLYHCSSVYPRGWHQRGVTMLAGFLETKTLTKERSWHRMWWLIIMPPACSLITWLCGIVCSMVIFLDTSSEHLAFILSTSYTAMMNHL